MTQPLKVVAYAVNGAGVGHLTRVLAILRWMRRLALCAGRRLDVYVLTTSEAGALALREGVAVFKLPSKTAVRAAGLPKEDYLRLARQWVWHSLGLLQPDLLVVDTFPGGTFGELGPVLDVPARKLFVCREVKAGFDAAGFAAWLPFYDRIVVVGEGGAARYSSDNDFYLSAPADPFSEPEELEESVNGVHGTDDRETQAERRKVPADGGCLPAGQVVSNGVVFPSAVRSRVRRVPPILLREPEELHDRTTARRRLGIPDGAMALWLSAGGGGDVLAERTLTALITALEPLDDVHLVVGAGPLFTGAPRRGRGITWLTEPLAVEDFAGLDAAISAAGFNATHELLAAGVPTALFAQEKIADDQSARVARLAAAGAVLPLLLDADGTPDAAGLAAIIADLRQPEVRARLRAQARSVVALGGARQAAWYGLQLVLDAGELQSATARATLRLCRWLEQRRPEAESCARLWALTAAVTDGDELAEWLEGLPESLTLEDMLVFLRRLPRLADADDLDHAFGLWRRLAGALESVGDERARTMFLRQMPWSRRASPEDQVRVLTTFLTAVGTSGDSLYRALAVLERHTAGAESDPWQWLSAVLKAAGEVRHGHSAGA
ncbi:hypothetical protein [Chloracidobacterium thermophilum]|uniref:hypothetical protein n=1 Tax=Chloracidobacterium thermophilum TaxID=458033 RepID=UPI0007388F01|nr:hypothetical protein [Chloracidobacterium thermophilum]